MKNNDQNFNKHFASNKKQYSKTRSSLAMLADQYEPDLVSIIIPCYNNEKYVADAIDSALSQTYDPKEIIVIDDGSTDHSLAVIKSYGNLITWRTKRNGGAPAARNDGLELARGEYIQFLDADDFLHQYKVAKQVTALADQPQNVAAYGDLYEIEEAQSGYFVYRTLSILVRPDDDTLKYWLGGWPKNPHLYLFHRNAIQKTGAWDESLVRNQDFDFGTRFLISGGKFKYCQHSAVFYRLSHDTSDATITSRKDNATWASRIKVLQKTEAALLKQGSFEDYRYLVANRYYYLACEASHDSVRIMQECLSKYYAISGKKKHPRSLLSNIMVRIIGLQNTEMLCSHLSKIRREKITANRKWVKRTNQLYLSNQVFV